MATQAELKAIAKLDGKGFEDGIDKIKGKTEGFVKQLSGMKGMIAGAFSIGAIVMFGKKMLTMADDLATTANTVGITMESMLGLKSAMAESGIDADRMLKVLSRLPIAQGEVIAQTQTMVDALNGLGISQEEFVSLAPDALMERLGQAYADAGGSAEAFNAISDIFGGRIGPEMIEVLDRINREGLAKFTEESKGAAGGMEQLAQASDTLEKTWDKVVATAAKLLNFVTRLGKAAAETARLIAMMPVIAVEETAAWAGRMSAGDDSKGLGESLAGRAVDEYKASVEAVTAELVKAENEAAARKKKIEDDAAARAMANLEAIKKAQEEADKKREARRLLAEKRLEKEQKKQADIMADYDAKRADLASGKGVPVPGMSAVDSLQRVGGIVGGVAGAGSQEARIMERQAKAAEMIEELTQNSLKKLEDIETRIRELGEG